MTPKTAPPTLPTAARLALTSSMAIPSASRKPSPAQPPFIFFLVQKLLQSTLPVPHPPLLRRSTSTLAPSSLPPLRGRPPAPPPTTTSPIISPRASPPIPPAQSSASKPISPSAKTGTTPDPLPSSNSPPTSATPN